MAKIPVEDFAALGLSSFALDEDSYRNCNVGDSILFSGLFLLAEWNNEINRGILSSQTPEGAPTRSVINRALQTLERGKLIGFRKGFADKCAKDPNWYACLLGEEWLRQPMDVKANFSKDMFLGLVAHQIANKESQIDQVEKERAVSAFSKVVKYYRDQGSLCDAGISDICAMYPTYINMERYVQKYIGTRKERIEYVDLWYDDKLWIAMFPHVKKDFFNSHMASVHAYLKARMGYATSSTKTLTNDIVEHDPNNLWKRFVHAYVGSFSSQFNGIASALISKIDDDWTNDRDKMHPPCRDYRFLVKPIGPGSEDSVENRVDSPPPPCRTEWVWEQSASKPEYNEPTGHELYMLGKLLSDHSGFAEPACGFEGSTGVPWEQEDVSVDFAVPDPNIEIVGHSIQQIGAISPTSFEQIMSGMESADGIYRFTEKDVSGGNTYKKSVRLRPGSYTIHVRHRFRHDLTATCQHRIEKLPKAPTVRDGIRSIFATAGDCPENYARDDFDLNKGTATGVPINLCYEQVRGTVHVTDIVGVTSVNDCPNGYVIAGIDLNYKAKGEFVFLCQKVEETSEEEIRPINEFFFYDTSSPGENLCPSGAGWHWVSQDLNYGTVGARWVCEPGLFSDCHFEFFPAPSIYMCFRR